MEMRGEQIPYKPPENKLVMRDRNGNIICFSLSVSCAFVPQFMHACLCTVIVLRRKVNLHNILQVNTTFYPSYTQPNPSLRLLFFIPPIMLQRCQT